MLESKKVSPEEKEIEHLKNSINNLVNDKRNSYRMSYIAKLCYTSLDSFGEEYSRNISTSGMFLETMDPFYIGQDVLLSIPFTGAEKYAKIKGEVVRITPHGVGIKFITKK